MKRVISIGISFILFVSCLFVINVGAAEACLLGDVNADGVISIADAHYVFKNKANYYSLNNEYDVLGDVDFDSMLTNEDVIGVLRIASGMDVTQTLEFDDWSTVTTPSCTSSGLESSYCASHNVTRNRIKAKLPHNYVDGVCSVCGTEKYENEAIIIYDKTVKFGATDQALAETFGEPTEILYDADETNAYTHYVYADDYTRLCIITYTSGVGVTGFYTNDVDATVVLDNVQYNIGNIGDGAYYDDVFVFPFVDGVDTGKAYAMYVSVIQYANIFNDFSNLDSNAKLIFHSTNGCRAINGVEPLTFSDSVAEVALYHSRDMATNNYFDHTSPNGETVSDRIEMFEIDCYGYGENIMAGYPFCAYDFTDGWYNSPGHRSNMLFSAFNEIGIGIYCNQLSEYYTYATQNFIVS